MKFLQIFIAILFSISLSAQKLEIQGKSPDLYVQHTVASLETLQTAGSRFGIAPAKLAAYNSLDPNAPLVKGTRIRIPLGKDNFVQVKTESGLPVYHVVGKGDNLYRISVNYNKVSTATLKDWNNMSADVVKNGQYIIVGFINGHAVSAPEEKKDLAKTKPPVDAPVVVPEKKKIDKPADKPVKNEVSVAPPVTNEKPVKETGYSPREGDEGYFAQNYNTQSGNQLKQYRSGDAAVFKTVSGWTDRKYYILMNDAAVGTIVRITGSNNKNICAKVLGPLQETKTGTSLLLRMSNAAAAALGAADPKFAVSVTYFE